MRRCAIGVVMACIGLTLSVRAADEPSPRLLRPLGRSAYQTNEMIDLSVVRQGGAECVWVS